MEAHIRNLVHSFWRHFETGIYTAVASLLALTALLALAGCAAPLRTWFQSWNSEDATLQMMDKLLLVLMLIEILHTVRISIRSHQLVPEPFLIVGLIATIRRMLVVALEAASFSRSDLWRQGAQEMFFASTIELAVLGLLVLVIVSAIWLLRRSPSQTEEAD